MKVLGLATSAWPELQYPDLYNYLINSPFMYYSHFHIVYFENLSTAIMQFAYLLFTVSNARSAREFHPLRPKDYRRALSTIFGSRC